MHREALMRQPLGLGLLVVLVVLVLSACGGEAGSGGGEEQAKASPLPEEHQDLRPGEYRTEEFKPSASFKVGKGWLTSPPEASDVLQLEYGTTTGLAFSTNYPDEVVGMVLLDSEFPEVITLEHYWHKEERLKYEDWSAYEEKIDQYDVYKYALQVTGKERDMPLTYLLATPLGEGWEGPPGWQEAVLSELDGFVKSFSPGDLKKVENPHFMEQAVPERIVKEVDALIASISQKQGAAHDGKGK